MKIKNRGNVKRQRKRRRERFKHNPPKVESMVELIDGNLSYYPVAYCKHYHGYLTQGLADVHRCVNRHCPRYKAVIADDEG